MIETWRIVLIFALFALSACFFIVLTVLERICVKPGDQAAEDYEDKHEHPTRRKDSPSAPGPGRGGSGAPDYPAYPGS